MVGEKNDLILAELLCLEHVIQVGAHQIRGEINVVETLGRVGAAEQVQQLNNVIVVDMLEQSNLSVGAFRMYVGGKRFGQLFDRHFPSNF